MNRCVYTILQAIIPFFFLCPQVTKPANNKKKKNPKKHHLVYTVKLHSCLFTQIQLLSITQESLVIDTPRVRKQTRHYNSFEDDELMEFSELDSDSEERPSRTRRLGERSRRYLRAECFRVEKNLLIFGYKLRH